MPVVLYDIIEKSDPFSMQEIAKGQYSIYFNIPRLLFTLKLLLDLARGSILCTFSIWTLLHLLTVKSNVFK